MKTFALMVAVVLAVAVVCSPSSARADGPPPGAVVTVSEYLLPGGRHVLVSEWTEILPRPTVIAAVPCEVQANTPKAAAARCSICGAGCDCGAGCACDREAARRAANQARPRQTEPAPVTSPAPPPIPTAAPVVYTEPVYTQPVYTQPVYYYGPAPVTYYGGTYYGGGSCANGQCSGGSSRGFSAGFGWWR